MSVGGDRRVQEGLAGVDLVDGAHEVLRDDALEHVAGGAGLDDLDDVLVVVVHAEDEHPSTPDGAP